MNFSILYELQLIYYSLYLCSHLDGLQVGDVGGHAAQEGAVGALIPYPQLDHVQVRQHVQLRQVQVREPVYPAPPLQGFGKTTLTKTKLPTILQTKARV